MSEQLAILEDEIIANQVLNLIRFRIKHPGMSIVQACEELGMPYRRTLDWLNNGKLGDYLAQVHDVRSDVAQIMALEELPGIVEYQAKIAKGEVSPRGANPTAAAAFILEIARLGSKDDGRQTNYNQVNVFVPNMKDGAPVIDAPSRILED